MDPADFDHGDGPSADQADEVEAAAAPGGSAITGLLRSIQTLRSSLDSALVDGRDQSYAHALRLGGEAVAIQRAIEMLEYELARRVAIFDVNQAYAGDGYASTATWLADRTQISRFEASTKIKIGRLYLEFDGIDEAARTGKVSSRHAIEMSRLWKRFPKFFTESLDRIIDEMSLASTDDVMGLVRQLNDEAVADGGEEEDARLFEERNAYAVSSMNGSLEGHFTLHGEDAAAFKSAIDAGLQIAYEQDDALGEPNKRSKSQRVADVLADMGDVYLASLSAKHRSVRVRPQITAIVDYDFLAGDDILSANRHIDRIGIVGRETLRRMACDADIHPIFTVNGSMPLDHGRSVRTATAAQRRALEVRDRHCQGPGCNRPAWWCDAHHIVHWIDGGSTDLDNLVLLCRWHHHLVHDDGWTIHRDEDGLVVWTPPLATHPAARRQQRRDLRRRRREYRQRVERCREERRRARRKERQMAATAAASAEAEGSGEPERSGWPDPAPPDAGPPDCRADEPRPPGDPPPRPG